MKLVIVKEKNAYETRVATTPDITKEWIKLGLDVHIQSKAGDAAGYTDAEYEAAGATVSGDANALLKSADILLKLQPPSPAELSAMKKGAMLVGLLGSALNPPTLAKYAEHKLSAFALELLPRITRAQSMDVLSSQSNLAGYKAVIDAVYHYGQAIPMMMTAAGTIKPAKVLILGAGVAGLQAIATARRIGAIVSVFDVRPEVKEQVQSLGASFVEVAATGQTDSKSTGGYAKEMSEDYKKKQGELIHQTAKTQDIIICTALIPGRPAPMLLPEAVMKDMRPGSVVVDLATASGGNCAWSEKNEVVVKNGVTIIGYENMAGRLAKDASRLYARNILNFTAPMLQQKNKLKIDFEDPLITATLLTHEGEIVHPTFKPKDEAPAPARRKKS